MDRSRLHVNDFTVGWVCALPVERAAAEQLLDEKYEDTQHVCDGPFILGRMGRHNVVIGCLPAGFIGTNAAAVTATQMETTFPHLQIRLMVGIAGGVPSAETDMRLGDIVISQPNKGSGGVVQYDFGKTGANGQLERTGFLNAPPKLLLDAVTELKSRILQETSQISKHLSRFDARAIFTRAQAGQDVLFAAETRHIYGSTCENCDRETVVIRSPRDNHTPVIHYGTIASGNQVIKDAITRDRWSRELGGVLCFEMEAAGLMNDFNCLVIRGICDYADSHKNKSWQPYAAATAAACAKEVLSNIPRSDIPKVDQFLSRADMENLQQLPNAQDAPFNSFSKRNDPVCLVDTRTDLLQEIYNWVDGQDQRYLFWLQGMAGTGKSTVARSVCRRYFNMNRLAASFFFSRGGGDVGCADKFVSSIAVQLAHAIPALRPYVCEAIKARPGVTNQSLRDQWQWLVVGPLSKLDADDRELTYILIVDALDECENNNDIRIIVQLLAEIRSSKGIQLCVLVTSRPETSIRSGFRQMPAGGYYNFVLHNILPLVVDQDIFKFLWHELALINQEQLLDTEWPGEEIVSALVRKASGLFIWASTACRFIRDGFPPEDSLQAILEGSTDSETPEEHLNDIYVAVLQRAARSYRERERPKLYIFLQKFVGAVVILFSPLSTKSLCSILSVQKTTANTAISHLSSIINISTEPSQPLRLHHPSFRDFLLNNNRCTDPNFWVDEEKAHANLTQGCIELMSDSQQGLKQDICNMEAFDTLVTEVELFQVDECVSPELQYACLYWVRHLRESGTMILNENQIQQFLNNHLLHWLEALSWMRKVSDGITAIISLQSIVENHRWTQLSGFVHDMRRFALYHRSVMELAPLQIYCSALSFSPKASLVRRHFEERFPQRLPESPKIYGGLPEIYQNWDAALQTLENHKGSPITAITFSPDGTLLASAAEDHKIKLLDVATGAQRMTLNCARSVPLALAFSPDGAVLASFLTQSVAEIRLWDVATGAVRMKLKGSKDDVVSIETRYVIAGRAHEITFSKDGAFLALMNSTKNLIGVWDLATGIEILLNGLDDWRAETIAFSSDSAVLASGSVIKKAPMVRLWHVPTGAALMTLESNNAGGHKTLISSLNSAMLLSMPASDIDTLWNATTFLAHPTLEGYTDDGHYLTFSEDRTMIASTLGTVGEMTRTSGEATGAAHTIGTFKYYQDSQTIAAGIAALTFSPNNAVLASGSWTGIIKLWDTTMLATTGKISREVGIIASMVFSPDGAMLASGSSDGKIKIWDVATGMVRKTLEGHTKFITHLAFSPDGTLLASVDIQGNAKVWDTTTGAPRMSWTSPPILNHLCFSGNGAYLSTGHAYHEITDKGIIPVDEPRSDAVFSQEDHPRDIFLGAKWISFRERRMIWLPLDRRAPMFATHGNIAAFGDLSDDVTFIDFSSKA